MRQAGALACPVMRHVLDISPRGSCVKNAISVSQECRYCVNLQFFECSLLFCLDTGQCEYVRARTRVPLVGKTSRTSQDLKEEKKGGAQNRTPTANSKGKPASPA